MNETISLRLVGPEYPSPHKREKPLVRAPLQPNETRLSRLLVLHIVQATRLGYGNPAVNFYPEDL